MKTFLNVVYLAFSIVFTCPFTCYSTDDHLTGMNQYIDQNKSGMEEYKIDKKEGNQYLLTLKSGSMAIFTIEFSLTGQGAYLDKLRRVGVNAAVKSSSILNFFNHMMDSIGVNEIELHVVPEDNAIGNAGPNPQLARIYWEAGYDLRWNTVRDSIYPLLTKFYKTFCPAVPDAGHPDELLKNSNVISYLQQCTTSDIDQLNQARTNVVTELGRQDLAKAKAILKDGAFPKVSYVQKTALMVRTKGANSRTFNFKDQPACWQSNEFLKGTSFLPK